MGRVTRRVLLAAAASAALLAACSGGVEFDDKVANPAFKPDSGPIVLFDHAHHNRHELGSTYEPFARLLKNDGFRLRALNERLSAEALKGGTILAIVSAQSQTETNSEPAFTDAEIAALVQWVRDGGSLLLVTDHYPFPNAAASLAAALGLEVSGGMTFDPQNSRAGDESRLIFSRSNGLLAADAPARALLEGVSVVETFTGDAFRSLNASSYVLRLSATARNYTAVPRITRANGSTSVDVKFVDPKPASGWAQGVAFEFGRGRIVALAEAAMITAQEDGDKKLGMNAPGNDNKQFVLNLMRWLARAGN